MQKYKFSEYLKLKSEYIIKNNDLINIKRQLNKLLTEFLEEFAIEHFKNFSWEVTENYKSYFNLESIECVDESLPIIKELIDCDDCFNLNGGNSRTYLFLKEVYVNNVSKYKLLLSVDKIPDKNFNELFQKYNIIVDYGQSK